VTRSRRLHAAIARAVADRCATAGLLVPAPQAAFYLYPTSSHGVSTCASRCISTGADLAGHLLERYGAGVLPASAFGEDPRAIRVRVATACCTATVTRSGRRR
jgi:aspartate aminotransferase